MKRIIAFMLAALLVLSLAACQEAPVETTVAPVETTAPPTETTAAPTEATAPVETEAPTEPLTPEEQILQERRNTVLEYMRAQSTILWVADESFDYEIPIKRDYHLSIVAGRVYQGLPYTFASSALGSFLEYSTGQDEKGIHSITGLVTDALQGNRGESRIGIDCASAVALAWSQIGASITKSGTFTMCEDNGYLPVGGYENDPVSNENTAGVAAANGMDVMYAAYAQLQPADGLVKYGASRGSHAYLVENIQVAYMENGSIDGMNSYIEVLDQASSAFKEQALVWNEELGMEVCRISGKPRKYSFRTMFTEGYLPITCKELIDPSPLPEPEFTDTEAVFQKDTLLKGTINCNWWIDAVTIIISDPQGSIVQQAAATTIRYENRTFHMEQFITDLPGAIRGSVDPAALASGNYHCTVVCRLTTGEEFTVRDFDFTV